MRISRCKLNNRGNGIITVIVAIAFVSVLGAILLFSSYTNMQLKVMERTSKDTFYDAETVMNEIRAGVQGAVSEALVAAYTDVLIRYNRYASQPDPQAAAQAALFDAFKNALKDQGLYEPDASKPSGVKPVLATYCGATGYIDPDSIPDATVDIQFKEDIAFGADNVSLNGLQVTLERNGYASIVKSDILITVPTFNFAGSVDLSINDLSGLVTVAEGGIVSHASGGAIDGNAYGGNLKAELGPLEIDGLVVVKGDVTVKGETLTVTDRASFWARNIIVEDRGKLELGGAAYIANDLLLNGIEASAKLKGQYFGFGNSPIYSAESSAILINGQATKLDLSELERLTLSGHSFVHYDNSNEIVMGESISIKSNQLAYLVPAEDLGDAVPYNPYFTTSPAGEAYTTPVNVAYLEEGVVKETPVRVKPLITPFFGDPSMYACYYFYDFSDSTIPNLAEKHYAYYYQENETDITNFLQNYSAQLDSVNNVALHGGSYGTAGSTLYRDAGGEAQLIESKPLAGMSAGSIKQQYTNLCQSMNANFGAPEPDPFSFFVNKERLETVGGGQVHFIDPDGNTIAIVANGDMTVDSSADPYTNVKLILCKGNVKLTNDFEGLVFCTGELQLSLGKTLRNTDVANINKAMMAKDASGTRFDYYMKVKGDSMDASESGRAAWDLNELVSYQGWVKNPEG